jgi:predicted RNase H-like HicB family nuclease
MAGMRSRRTDLPLTIAYSTAENGWTTATIAALPGAISAGRTRDEARTNVLDALGELLARPFPEVLAEADAIERVNLRLDFGRDMRRAADR